MSLHNWIKRILFPWRWRQACCKLFKILSSNGAQLIINASTSTHRSFFSSLTHSSDVETVKEHWWCIPSWGSVCGFSHEAGPSMLIRAADRRPPGRLMAGPSFISPGWAAGPWPDLGGSRGPLLTTQHGRTSSNKEAFSVSLWANGLLFSSGTQTHLCEQNKPGRLCELNIMWWALDKDKPKGHEGLKRKEKQNIGAVSGLVAHHAHQCSDSKGKKLWISDN